MSAFCVTVTFSALVIVNNLFLGNKRIAKRSFEAAPWPGCLLLLSVLMKSWRDQMEFITGSIYITAADCGLSYSLEYDLVYN